MYIRTDNGGAYRFDANMNLWTWITRQWAFQDKNYYGIDGISVDPSDDRVVYIVAGKNLNEQGGIFKSIDRGESWTRLKDVAFAGNGPLRWAGSNVASYVFNGDMNGDGANGNDLIYIPRDASEMNFVQFTSGGRTFTPAEQAAAFEAYIQQDPYLKDHRGEYAKRGGLNMAMFNRADLSIVQDVFKNIGGKRNAAQVRLDISNFSNLLNRDWGVSKRLVLPTTGANGAQILTNAAADAQGRASYRMAVVNNELVRSTFQGNTGLGDVYQIMLSFRYSFN